MITGDATVYLYDSKDTLIGLQRMGKTYYIASDPNGTPLALFDNRGYVVKQCKYTPLGLRFYDSSPNFDLPFGFQGRLYIDAVQLSFFDRRVYDAHLGRFLTPDYDGAFEKLKIVLEDPESLNLYQYKSVINRHLYDLHHPSMGKKDLCFIYFSKEIGCAER